MTKFAVYSDSRPVDNETYWEVLHNKLNGYKFVVNCGDFTEWSWPWEYRYYVTRMGCITVPVYNVIGNHDDRLFGPWLFKSYFSDYNYTLDDGNWRFIFIRNAYVLKYGITRGTKSWLHQILRIAHDNEKYVGIFSHVPPFEAFGDLGVPQDKLLKKDRLTDVIAEYMDTIKFAFYGHSHLYAHAEKYNTHFYISGGAALPEDLHECPENPPSTLSAQHATIVETFDDGGFVTNLMRTDGTIDDRYAVDGRYVV